MPILTISSIAPIDIAQDHSSEVREDTAELASWALSDKPSIGNASSPTAHLVSPTSLLTNDATSNRPILLDYSRAEDLPCPDVIPELSEPVSPSSVPSSRKSPGMSALSEMFKSTPPTGEGDSSTDDEDQSMCNSRLGAVTVQAAIISQPTEQTALLLQQQAHRSNASNRQSYLGDLENQKSRQSTTTVGYFTNLSALVNRYSSTAAARLTHPKTWETRALWDQALLKPASYIPAVILGLLLNILDALSYGQ